MTSQGDLVTGIERVAADFAGRGVLLDVATAIGEDGELPDGFAITPDHLAATIAAQGASATVGRGDILCVRTSALARARRDGWGDYAGGPAPGLSFGCAGWLHDTEIAAIATDTWGFEVRRGGVAGWSAVVGELPLVVTGTWGLAPRLHLSCDFASHRFSPFRAVPRAHVPWMCPAVACPRPLHEMRTHWFRDPGVMRWWQIGPELNLKPPGR